MAADLGSPRGERTGLPCPSSGWAPPHAWSCPVQRGLTLPYRALTGQPSGKWSGVQRRKSGQPRSLSTMAQGPRVAWQRVRLGSSTRSFSHLGMYTAHSRGWITAQQRGAFRRPAGKRQCAHITVKTPPHSDPETQLPPCSPGLCHIIGQYCLELLGTIFLNRALGRMILCTAGLSHVLKDT